MTARLVVALGPRRYRVERPFGAWPANAGFVSDVVVDSRGHVFVLLRHDPLTEPADPRIIELDPVGAFVRSFGTVDIIADGHLMTPHPAGGFLVVDRDMHEVVQLTADGTRCGGIGGRGHPLAPFNHPSDVAVAPSGEIYVSDGYAGRFVHRFAADGTPLGRWGGPGDGPGRFGEPHSLWAHADGRIAVVDRVPNRVQVFDPAGHLLQIWTGFHRPVAITGDAAGFTYVTDQTPNLHLFDPEGGLVGTCRPVLNGAHGIWVTGDGVIFLAEVSPSRVTRLVPLAPDAA